MKRDNALDILLRRAGQREGDTTLKNQLIDEMQLAQESLEQQGVVVSSIGAVFWPQFLLTEVSTTQTSKGEPRVETPSDFLVEYEQSNLYIFDPEGDKEWKPLTKESWDTLRREYSGESGEQDEPEFYALVGSYFYLFPVPDARYDLKLIYYGADTVLDSDIENEWLKRAPWLLISATGEAMAWGLLHDQRLAQQFRQHFQAAAIQLFNAEGLREYRNTSFHVGDLTWEGLGS